MCTKWYYVMEILQSGRISCILVTCLVAFTTIDFLYWHWCFELARWNLTFILTCWLLNRKSRVADDGAAVRCPVGRGMFIFLLLFVLIHLELTFHLEPPLWTNIKKNRRYHKSLNKKEVTVILKLPFGKCFNVNIPLWMTACHDSYVW